MNEMEMWISILAGVALVIFIGCCLFSKDEEKSLYDGMEEHIQKHFEEERVKRQRQLFHDTYIKVRTANPNMGHEETVKLVKSILEESNHGLDD